MNWTAKWITPEKKMGYKVPIFSKTFSPEKEVASAKMYISAMGVYEAKINGERVGDFILAPGWTAYEKRLQYQSYDVTQLIKEENRIEILVAHGWYYLTLRSEEELYDKPNGLIAELHIEYKDQTSEIVATDETWSASESCMKKSEIYDGEIYDASFTPTYDGRAITFQGNYSALIEQEGNYVKEIETISPKRIFKTPKGETVIDFGQNLTGYILTKTDAKKGDIVDISYAEVLDREGNFYNENYLNAKCEYHYICRDGVQEHKPSLTFCGFRYIRVNEFPSGIDKVTTDSFTAITLHTEMKRTGYIETSNPLLNQLFSNVIWGQKGNFLDIPSDCPQRNERLGWTGDAQVFARTASYNFDCEKFFSKWLADARAEQGENGFVPYVVPDVHKSGKASPAWGDVITIIPCEIYRAFGDKKILCDNFDAMKKWVDFYDTIRKEDYTLNEKFFELSFGDWLGLDSPSGSWRGSTKRDLIYLAFYYYSTVLLCYAGKVLNRDVEKYKILAEKLKNIFRKKFPEYKTQTECVLAIHFGLAKDLQATSDLLAEMVTRDGHLTTGFVGTPYLLHALGNHGHADLAYSLLLNTEYPSWLYPVTKGATTIWEHWDSIMPDGSFWDKKMNSFNHYAYGSVMDWVYCFAAGINPTEEYEGYAHATITPHPDTRLDFLSCAYETRHGKIEVKWEKAESEDKKDSKWKYSLKTPVNATVKIDGTTYEVESGEHTFYGKM